MPELLRRQILDPVSRWLGREYLAIPVDLFRVLVGLLAASWFVRLLVECPAISHPWGLIDREVSQDVYWFTRMGAVLPAGYAAVGHPCGRAGRPGGCPIRPSGVSW